MINIGTDIVEIKKIDRIKEKANFYSFFFTQREYDYIKKKKFSSQTIAGIFAAKEAVVKSLKTGFCANLSVKDIEILHDGSIPYLNLRGYKLKKYLSIEQIKYIDISISHDGAYAIAQAISEK